MFLVILIIFLIYNISYNLYSNLYGYKIYKLLKNRNIISIENRSKELLNKPLCEFIVNTSHNTYLNSLQHISLVKTKTIQNILKLGARCIELDISHIKNKPIIAHGTSTFITTSFISLENALDGILTDGFNTSDPLIIFCEIYNPENRELNENIKNIFINKFGNRIAKKNINDDYIADKPIGLFLNKIIILGTTDKFNILSEIMYPRYNFINLEDSNPRLLKVHDTTQLSRVYKTEGIRSYFSFNIDFKPLWKNKYYLIGMNFQMKDKLLYDYLSYFKNASIIHNSELKL